MFDNSVVVGLAVVDKLTVAAYRKRLALARRSAEIKCSINSWKSSRKNDLDSTSLMKHLVKH